ncbi:MAG: glycoside hydrolase family 127 protein [Bacteroidales bacterium]|nr:glycoside hydrolase family 127 protein [Bacteroidales bacterium]
MNLAAAIGFMLSAATTTAQVADLDGGPMGIERVAMSVGTAIPYISVPSAHNAPNWVQIDLGQPFPVEAVKLYPYFQDKAWPGAFNHNFPIRFRIEAANNADMTHPTMVVDQTTTDYVEAIPLKIETYKPDKPLSARYVRLTVIKPDIFELWRFEVISGGKDVAEGKLLSDSEQGFLGKHVLLRPQRPAGESVQFDHPEQVTAPETWKAVKAPLQTPRSGVTVGGLFKQTFDRNNNYLLTSFSVNDMAYPIRERAGKDPGVYDREFGKKSWFVNGLGGSIAGRYLMGAGNALRWENNKELRQRLNQLVDIIEECAAPNGFIYGYAERTILQGQNNSYARGWLSQGLVEAGAAGNQKAWDLLRKGCDWFNSSPYLPEMQFRVPIGNQGMVASSRTYMDTNVGVPADIQVLQRYFQLNFWLDQLAARDPDALWLYQYERVHSYLIIVLNAYMDIYMATGDQERYLKPMLGAWDLFYDYFMHTGGTISLIESYTFPPKQFPPKSYLLRSHTGETCGNVFWAAFNQQLRILYPEGEKYVAEIEKSIYNMGIANQAKNGNIRYHTCLIGKKGGAGNTGTCCEGQGTRFFGMLPEFIYKISDDGLYVDLYNESTIQWQQNGKTLSLHQHSDFPLSQEVKLHLKLKGSAQSKIYIRVPSWAVSSMDILVNGKKVASGTPGSYVALSRKWNNKDEISFTLPAGFRLTKYNGTDPDFQGKEAYALEYGPLLMAVVDPSVNNGILNIPLSSAELLAKLKPAAGKPLHFTVSSEGKTFEYAPYYAIDDETFTCYPFLKK